MGNVYDAVNEWENTRKRGGGAGTVEVNPSCTAMVRNDSGEDRSVGHILAITGATDAFPDDPAQVNRRPYLIGSTPADETDAIAILHEPIDAGDEDQKTFGRAVVAGIATCVVNITDDSHQFAKPIPGDCTKLESDETGPVRILAREDSTTGEGLCVVLLGGNSPTGASDDDGEYGRWVRAEEEGTYVTGTVLLPSDGTSPGDYVDGYEVRLQLIPQPASTIFRAGWVYWATLNGIVEETGGQFEIYHGVGHGKKVLTVCINAETGETRCDAFYAMGLHIEEGIAENTDGSCPED